MGLALLSVVGAWPPHDRIREARRINLSSVLSSLLSGLAGDTQSGDLASSTVPARGACLRRRTFMRLRN
jgi:hypothetical protein